MILVRKIDARRDFRGCNDCTEGEAEVVVEIGYGPTVVHVTRFCWACFEELGSKMDAHTEELGSKMEAYTEEEAILDQP